MSVAYALDGAVCEGVARADYDPFFPETPEAEADALAMCRICPAKAPCLAYAVETGQAFGIWGGKTQAQIRRLIGRNRAGRARGRRPATGPPQRAQDPLQARPPVRCGQHLLRRQRGAPLSRLPPHPSPSTTDG